MSDTEDFGPLPKIDEIDSKTGTIKAVLDEKYYDQVPTLRVYAAKVDSPKKISAIMKKLNEISPLPTLQHLKRVKRNEQGIFIILDVLEETELDLEPEPEPEPPAKRVKLEENDCVKKLSEKGFDVKEFEISEVSVAEVPRYGPKTRNQYNKAMEYWPVNFHPEKKLETMMSEEIFNKSEYKIHVDNMKYLIKEAITRRKNFALVVDPSGGGYVARGWDISENHPLHHAVMVAVDAVAKTQNGGAWDLPFGELTFDFDPSKNVKDDSGPYLCTGYDLYVFREPCVMCAMALVHSRIKRVFFYVSNEKKGAYVSRCQIHTLKDLNHHYEVFRFYFSE